jgi:hypothetical protein
MVLVTLNGIFIERYNKSTLAWPNLTIVCPNRLYIYESTKIMDFRSLTEPNKTQYLDTPVRSPLIHG